MVPRHFNRPQNHAAQNRHVVPGNVLPIPVSSYVDPKQPHFSDLRVRRSEIKAVSEPKAGSVYRSRPSLDGPRSPRGVRRPLAKQRSRVPLVAFPKKPLVLLPPSIHGSSSFREPRRSSFAPRSVRPRRSLAGLKSSCIVRRAREAYGLKP